MSQSTPFHDSGVIGIAKFSLGGTLINSIQLLGSVSGEYALVVFNSEGEHEMLDPEKSIELANYIHRLIVEYPASRLQQVASEAAAEAAVHNLDEVYADVDKEAEKYRSLLGLLVNQSQDPGRDFLDETDLSE